MTALRVIKSLIKERTRRWDLRWSTPGFEWYGHLVGWWVLSFWELKRLMYWGDWYGIDSRIWPYVRIAQVLRPWRLSRIDPYAGLQGISKIRLAPLQNVCWWRIEGTARGQSWRDVHPVDPSLLRLEVWLVPTYKLRVRGSEGYVVLTDYRI